MRHALKHFYSNCVYARELHAYICQCGAVLQSRFNEHYMKRIQQTFSALFNAAMAFICSSSGRVGMPVF